MIFRKKRCGALREGFTLVEVVLAIGVLSVAVLALIGMFAPTMQIVREVMASDYAVASIENINYKLQEMARADADSDGNDFGDLADIVSSAPGTAPTNALFVFTLETAGYQLTAFAVAARTATGSAISYNSGASSNLKAAMEGNLLASEVLRVEIYQLPASQYETSYNNHLTTQGFLPFEVRIFRVDPANPGATNALQVLSYNSAVLR